MVVLHVAAVVLALLPIAFMFPPARVYAPSAPVSNNADDPSQISDELEYDPEFQAASEYRRIVIDGRTVEMTMRLTLPRQLLVNDDGEVMRSTVI